MIPPYPGLLGGQLCLDFANSPRPARPTTRTITCSTYADLVRWGRHVSL